MNKFEKEYYAMLDKGFTKMSGYNADMAIDPEYIEWHDKHISSKKHWVYEYIKDMTCRTFD
tara:strand:+ start:562 stop:744 length:183 start_codon:yes stop_codon:yes gene_type:complete